MPYLLDTWMRVTRTLPMSGGEQHRALNALFYHWLEAAEPSLAKFVHDLAEPKPFTISTLQEDGEGHYRFSISLLEDNYASYILKGMEQEKTVRVGNEILEIEGAPQVTHCSYAALWADARREREIILQFDSPMSFRVNELDDPLPFPRRVFQSYLTKWNAFSGEPLEPFATFLEWIEQSVAVARFDLKTELLRFDAHVQIGAVGRVQYRVAKGALGDESLLKGLNVLADFAGFCGTGRKTTQGMGQTRRLARW